jgi:hypothetical protein
MMLMLMLMLMLLLFLRLHYISFFLQLATVNDLLERGPKYDFPCSTGPSMNILPPSTPLSS